MTADQYPLVAIGVFVAYTALVTVLWKVNHVRYDAIAESRDTIVKGIVVPIGLGGLLLALATTWLGWWQPVLVQEPRSGPTWALVVPVLFGLTALVGVSSIDIRSEHRRVLPLLALGVLFVGFAEEVATRGLLIVGAREGGWSEWAVFALSTGLFALLHGINAFFGQSLGRTVVQIGMAFLAGSALYVTRMTTGTLLVCMLLHALWDFGTLGSLATKATLRPGALVLVPVTFVLGLVAAWFVVAGS